MLDDLMITELKKLAAKEEFLSRVVTWLKAKGLWEECLKDCGPGLVRGAAGTKEGCS